MSQILDDFVKNKLIYLTHTKGGRPLLWEMGKAACRKLLILKSAD